MTVYNRMKAADRVRERQDRQAELDAIEAGTWPRDIDDQFRWNNPSDKYTNAEWAARMCRADIDYLNDLDTRIDQGDPTLRGWERLCPYCQNTGWMWAFGLEVKCNRHAPEYGRWYRWRAGRLATDESEPAPWLMERMRWTT